MIKIYFIFTFLFIFSLDGQAQDIVTDLNQSVSSERTEGSSFIETIKLIGQSRKIFLLTNKNQQLFKGDFITLAINNEAIARFLVAKNKEELVGIKALRIYSLARWQMMAKEKDVQVIRGDDSYLFKPKKSETEDIIENSKIESEEDLYNDKGVGQVEEYGDRHIKPDSILGAGYGKESVEDFYGDRFNNDLWSFQYAYQFTDNWYVEGIYNSVRIDDYPSKTLETQMNIYQARLKYNIKAPLYSFVMPYIGYESTSANSPDAGNIKNDSGKANRELQMIDDMSQQKIIFGATILRRLVPGWFARLDLGLDGLTAGFSIEF